MLNKVQLIGNVGQDPEIRSMNSGDRVANLSIATSEKWKDKNSGEKKERTEWHRVVVWGPLVDVIDNYVNKGDRLFLEGQLQTRKWQDQSGNDRYSTEVVLRGFDAKLIMLSGKKDGGGRGEYAGRNAEDRYTSGGYGGAGGYGGETRQDSRGNNVEDFNPDLDDEIPF